MVLSAYSHGGTRVLYPDVNIRGTRGSPNPLPVGVPGALNGGWDMGKPGFPTPHPEAKVWEGAALQRVSPALEWASWNAEGKWANEWETNKRMLRVCLTLR